MNNINFPINCRYITATFIFIFSLGGFAQDHGEGNWVLIYENDAEGNSVFGDLDDLIGAVRNGESVRISWYHQSPSDSKRKVEHLADAKFITIMSDQTVLAQIDPIAGQVPDFDKQQITLKENLEWSLIASSNGKNDQMTRNVVTGEIVDHGIRNWGTKWFVKRR